MSAYMDFGFLCKEPSPPTKRKIAVIGAGPSGLAAAGYLAARGNELHVFDKLPKAGGLMVFGIPGHRIPQERIENGVRRLQRDLGVTFHLRTKICCSTPLFEEEGDHYSAEMHGLGELVEDHDAVVICSGSWKSKRLGIDGENLPGVYTSLEFLFPIRAARYGAPSVSVPDVKGKRVAVIGAGHSAVDVAHSAVNLEAEKVIHVYRKTAAQAPCGTYEIEKLIAMGVDWREYTSPINVEGEQSVSGLRVSVADGEQKREDVIAVDVVVTAIGENPTPPFAKELGLENVRKGEVRWLNMTAIENVFVAGDALTGPSKIGKAVYSGLRAAKSLGNWLDLKANNREDEYAYDDFVNPVKGSAAR